MATKITCNSCGAEVKSIVGRKDVYGVYEYGSLIDDDSFTRFDYCKECGIKAANLLNKELNKK